MGVSLLKNTVTQYSSVTTASNISVLSSTAPVLFLLLPFVPHFHYQCLSSSLIPLSPLLPCCLSPLCSRSIESLRDNQKYWQLQKELSQVLTQRQTSIEKGSKVQPSMEKFVYVGVSIFVLRFTT